MRPIYEYLLNKSNAKDIGNEKTLISKVTDNPKEFTGYNYLVNAQGWKAARVRLFVPVVKEMLSKGVFEKHDLDFVKKWFSRLKEWAKYAVDSSWYSGKDREELLWIFNGDEHTFGNAKLTYDIIKYALENLELTIPQKTKFEKILREYYQTVEQYKDEMNWY